jgi:hypothetical protein
MNLYNLPVYRLIDIIVNIFPGLKEAVVGEITLSRGSDCDAVWLCPRRMKTPIAG